MFENSKNRCRVSLFVLLMLAGFVLCAQAMNNSHGKNEDESTPDPNQVQDSNVFTADFNIESLKFVPLGVNPYFILKPCYQLVLEGQDGNEVVHVEITVLPKTKVIQIQGIGKVTTRIVLEQEWVDDELVEESRNFFAISKKTNDVFYFGEEVDIYEDGNVVSHDGSWLAGKDGAMPGIIMPGTFLLGSKYYQEIAPDVALDRAEHIAMGLTIDTEAGTFDDSVEILETTPLEPGAESIKQYARGIGLINDDGVELVDYGFVKHCGCIKKNKD